MLAVIFGVFAGLALGLTGSGGSIFAVPMLVYGLRLPMSEAVAVSLIGVAAIAAAGAVRGIYARLAEVRTALLYAAAGMLGAPLGIRLAERVPDAVQLAVFAVLMLVIGAMMWRKAASEESGYVRAQVFAREAGDDAAPVCRYTPEGALHLTAPCMLALVAAGFVTGILAGLFGVGGGFLIVPSLRLATGLTMRRAIATSLVIIALVSTGGVASFFAGGGSVDGNIAGIFIVGGLAGLMLGALVARRLAGGMLQRLFAVLIGLTGVSVLMGELLLV